MSFPNQIIRDSFIRDLSCSLINSHTECLSNFNNPQEPDFVAFLIRDIVNNTGILLKNYLPTACSKVYGVFCHQSPKVKFQNPNPNQKNCAELEDLLIVYTETVKKHNPRSQALLLQAKCTDKIPHSIGSNEMQQLYLYQNWPDFTYVTPSALANQSRIITFQCINGIQDNTIVNLSSAEPESFNSDFIQDGIA